MYSAVQVTDLAAALWSSASGHPSSVALLALELSLQLSEDILRPRCELCNPHFVLKVIVTLVSFLNNPVTMGS
jgi:hypothetical protein